jgi:hypothetical protein
MGIPRKHPGFLEKSRKQMNIDDHQVLEHIQQNAGFNGIQW